jgi:hypothetical protein
VRSEFIGRGKYTIVPDSTGVDGLLSGVISSVTLTPVNFNQANQATRYALTLSRVGRVQGHAHQQGAVVEPVDAVSRGIRPRPRRAPSTPTPSWARTSTRASAWPTNSRAPWSAPSSKPSEAADRADWD